MKKIKHLSTMKITPFMSFIAVAILFVSIAILSPLIFGAGFLGAAIFTPSPAMGEIRGKAGSDVWSKNHYGGFFRKLVKPINPQSTAQTFVRNSLKALAKSWKSLSTAQIAGWNNLAKSMILSNSLGQKSTMTGENAYISNNQHLLMAGESSISNPPSIADNAVAGLKTFIATAVHAGAVTLTYTDAVPAGHHMLVYASGNFSNGITYNKTKKFLGAYVAGDTSPLVVTTEYNALFGSPAAANEKIYFYAKIVDNASGFVSAESKAEVLTT